MGRHRSRSYSPRRFSRSPPRRKRYDDLRDRYRGGGGRDCRDRRSSAPSGLLIRNVALDARSEDLRIPFERFGPVKDVYLPKNYYTGEPRGFGFVKFRYSDDAAVAKQHMNHQVICGREISIVYAEENRKTPQEMRTSSRISERYMEGGYRKRSSQRSPSRRYHSYSRSPSARRRESRDYEKSTRDDYYSPPRSISQSPNARDNASCHQSPSPRGIGRSPTRSRSYSIMEVEQDVEDDIVVEEEDIKEGVSACLKSLVGHLLSDRPFSAETLESALKSIWGHPEGFRVLPLGDNIFQFFFDCALDAVRVEQGGPWLFKNYILNLKRWRMDMNMVTEDFIHVPIWIQIWGLPEHYKTFDLGRKIGSRLGEVMEVVFASMNGLESRIVKAKVMLDVTKPLQDSLRLAGIHKQMMVKLRYEHIGTICFYCCHLGHEMRLCKQYLGDSSKGATSHEKGGSWLRADQVGRRLKSSSEPMFSSSDSAEHFEKMKQTQVCLLRSFHSLSVNEKKSGSSSQVLEHANPASSVIPSGIENIGMKQQMMTVVNLNRKCGVSKGVRRVSSMLADGFQQLSDVPITATSHLGCDRVQVGISDGLLSSNTEVIADSKTDNVLGSPPLHDQPAATPILESIELPSQCKELFLNSSLPWHSGEANIALTGLTRSQRAKCIKMNIMAELGQPTEVSLKTQPLNQIDWGSHDYIENFHLAEGKKWKDPVQQVNWNVLAVHFHSNARIKNLQYDRALLLLSRSASYSLVIGDFNAISSLDEKQGGRQKSPSSVAEFIDFINMAGLVDLDYIGPKFTWNNKSISGALIQERLDRGLATGPWRHLYPMSLIHHLDDVGSDHRPLMLISNPITNNRHRRFKFQERWCSSEAVKTTSIWGMTTIGSPMYRLFSKLKNCRHALVNWQRTSSHNSHREIGSLHVRLSLLKADLANANRKEILQLEHQLVDAYDREEHYWKEKSMVKWLNWGDQNTKFFHSKFQLRNRHNKIWRLQDDSGGWCTTIESIGEHTQSYFQDLFTSSSPLDPTSSFANMRTKASETHCRNLINILHTYGSFSGQNVNLDKSTIFFSKNTSLPIREQLAALLQVPNVGAQDKYLGLPSLVGR
ncbi:hypothetical protein Cni_G25177 [Canna indica]|uniref:RRM domain-containing protein n=1 Tax=Canna indica TaxID=4628 RepID=A0AAQ3KXD6_9LILI|nr:hypothetical protein Cni_G25177 [Canna indica]